MNEDPVVIIANFTNKLRLTDYIQVRFDYRTYGLVSGPVRVNCSGFFNCTYDAAQSTLYMTVIKVVPTDNSTLNEPIVFSIEGLNSSSTTFPTQQFEVVLRSYTVDNRQMDEGKFMYSLNCKSADILNKTCRTCNESLKVCYSCYSGYYLYALNGTCVTDCPSASTYRTYAGNTSCDPCTNNCSTCLSLTQCLTCIQGFYLH